MSEEKDDLKSIKVYKFDNTKEKWHEFALKFRVIADTRDYRGIIDGSVVPPDKLAVITITAEDMTEFRQPLQVQSHLEMPRILVQLGRTQRAQKLAPQTGPKRSPTRSVTRYQDQISVKCTRRTLRMPRFTRATHAQPSLSNFTRRDSDFGEPTRSRGTTRLEQNFPTSPQNKKTKLTHRSLYMSLRTILTPHVN